MKVSELKKFIKDIPKTMDDLDVKVNEVNCMHASINYMPTRDNKQLNVSGNYDKQVK